MSVNFLSIPTFSWRNPISFNHDHSLGLIVWGRLPSCASKQRSICVCISDESFQVVRFYSFWLGGRKLLVHCPCRFIGLFWSKYMSGRESNERMTLVFSQVIISPTLQWHISSKFASSSHDPQFIGAHHVRSLPYLSLQWIDNTKVKPFASNYWSTCLLHRIRKVSSNHLIYSSKGNKSLTLESYICHWNYIQIFIHSSNTRFCMLKVILKLMVSTLDFKSWVVFTCMFLYTHMH